MPRSTRPRKPYRPRALRVPPVIRHSAAEEVHLQLVPHLDLERFRAGTAVDAIAPRLVVDATEVPPSAPTFADVEQHIRDATDVDGLAIVRALIPKVESAEDREELAAMAAVRRDELMEGA